MFTIIGADQKHYGPYTADEIRDWIAQGRADGRTLARMDGSADWKPLAEFPEFAGAAFAGTAPPRIPSKPPQYSYDPNAALLGLAPDFQIGDCIRRGAGLFLNNFGVLAGASAIVWMMDAILSRLPIVGIMFQGVVFGGLFLVFLKRIRNEETSIGEVFSGFGGSFVQLALTGFLYSLLSSLAVCACVLPMFYLLVAWIFALPLVIDKKLEFWTAMELSRKVAGLRLWFKVFALILVIFAPYIAARLYASHRMEQLWDAQAMPLIKEANLDFSNLPDSLQKMPDLLKKLSPVLLQIERDMTWVNLTAQLILLVNLPFGVGALMYAYENLFGTRRTPAP
jgi:hypothetical protein